MKAIENCRIEPAPGSDNLITPPSSLPLTFFDILWLRLPPVQRIFFFEFSHPTTNFFDSVLPKLKRSLALALRYFLPLSGHLTWPLDSPEPFIKYEPGDAISLVIAESDADFYHLSGFELCEASKCHHLIPHLNTSHDQASVLALQVTLFPSAGFSIGIASHHAVLDGKTSTLFMKSWAYLCNNLGSLSSPSSSSLASELVPFFDRAMIKDAKGLEARYVSDWLNHCGPDNRSLKVWDLSLPQEATRGVFDLTSLDIEKLKKFVAAEREGKKKENLHLSTFVVSCAYSWLCRVRAEGTKSERVQLAMNVDCRPRLDPPLPPTYFGNCIGNRMAVLKTSELLGEDGLVVAVETIVGSLETLKDGLLNGAENLVLLMQGGFNPDDRIIGSAGTPRFEVYSIDFGWGRAKKVEMSSIDRTGAICLSDSRNGNGGVEIGLVLERKTMEAFASLFVQGLESL